METKKDKKQASEEGPQIRSRIFFKEDFRLKEPVYKVREKKEEYK